ncbi:YslB family protein [Neobacillus sp. YIM B06451]|uniref:YslB family protein n=1 Tax=Neobacillus sp. YIM B06451 TaxID=3070994 RepID=UPI00292EBE9F|nr:YslB family protein [Neobacillus sp. YIM B06451]
MKEQTTSDLQSTETVTKFGYELIREILLPELLGKHAPELLYWAGKLLARKYPLKTLDELKTFFARASWGHLDIRKESKNEMEFVLGAVLLPSRVSSKAESYFQLEAGFLAQQIEFQKGVTAEAFEHPVKQSKIAVFTVKWDSKDPV